MDKYIQKTKLNRQRYKNMPSLCHTDQMRLHVRYNMNKVEWDKVDEICAKYGFSYTLIERTFSDKNFTFLLYFKTNIEQKSFECERSDDSMEYVQILMSLIPTKERMQDCIHELDTDTNLFFGCDEKGYNGIMVMTKNDILLTWSPTIHDTREKLTISGVFVTASTNYLKEWSPKENCDD